MNGRRKAARVILVLWVALWLVEYIAGLALPWMQPVLTGILRRMALCTPAVAVVAAFLAGERKKGRAARAVVAVYAGACLVILAASFLWPAQLLPLLAAAGGIGLALLAVGLVAWAVSRKKSGE